MYIYKFRLLFDEVDNFVRDYEISSEQTFKDFHDIIIQTIVGLKEQELTSFYICDRRWDKKIEITLIDMEMEENPNSLDDESIPRKVMSESILSDYIDDPHQRLIYEYDFLNLKTFYIELLKTTEIKAKQKYPQCVYHAGEISESKLNFSPANIDVLAIDEGTNEEDETKDYYDEEDIQALNDDIEI